MNLKDLTDKQLVRFYRAWSEEYYCAGFISPSPETVDRFIEWLRAEPHETDHPFENYELKMVHFFREKVGEE